MKYLEEIEHSAKMRPDACAVSSSSGCSMTYSELWTASEAIASYIRSLDIPAHEPIVVYGHKSPYVVACFHGCLKSGHAYVPIDMYSVPDERALSIVNQIGDPLIFEVGGSLFQDGKRCIDERGVVDIVSHGGASERGEWVSGEDISYIIFTSGSTGAPKGVQVTAACIDNFCEWALTIGSTDKTGRVFLNQAPYSFDLSVFELAMALWAGGTIWSLEKSAQVDTATMFEALTGAGVQVWVSTPSFADLCLVNKEFNAQSMPSIELFLFCGETLTNSTALRLQERFPDAVVVNTYGPTESTVAITQVEVTPEIAAAPQPIPCGVPREGTRIRIVDAKGEDCAIGSFGEVVIEGDTVAKGYYGRPDLTKKAFGTTELGGAEVRTYRTGDEGCLDEAGNLHYRGRLDLQVKLNGFRIELGDIEENLRKLEKVNAAVVIPVYKEGKVSHLVAHVVSAGSCEQSDFRKGLELRNALKDVLPYYMIPKKFVFHESLPMTPNGKVDRRALAAL